MSNIQNETYPPHTHTLRHTWGPSRESLTLVRSPPGLICSTHAGCSVSTFLHLAHLARLGWPSPPPPVAARGRRAGPSSAGPSSPGHAGDSRRRGGAGLDGWPIKALAPAARRRMCLSLLRLEGSCAYASPFYLSELSSLRENGMQLHHTLIND